LKGRKEGMEQGGETWVKRKRIARESGGKGERKPPEKVSELRRLPLGTGFGLVKLKRQRSEGSTGMHHLKKKRRKKNINKTHGEKKKGRKRERKRRRGKRDAKRQKEKEKIMQGRKKRTPKGGGRTILMRGRGCATLGLLKDTGVSVNLKKLSRKTEVGNEGEHNKPMRGEKRRQRKGCEKRKLPDGMTLEAVRERESGMEGGDSATLFDEKRSKAG